MAETRTVTINADGIQEREVMYVRSSSISRQMWRDSLQDVHVVARFI